MLALIPYKRAAGRPEISGRHLTPLSSRGGAPNCNKASSGVEKGPAGRGQQLLSPAHNCMCWPLSLEDVAAFGPTQGAEKASVVSRTGS